MIRGESHLDAQTWHVVFDAELNFVQLSNRGNKRQTESGPTNLGAALEAIKSLENAVAFHLRNTETIVPNLRDDIRTLFFQNHVNARAGGRMSNRVIHNVRDHFCKQLAIAPRVQERLYVGHERLSLVLCQIAESIRDSFEEFGKIDFTKAALPRTAFNLSDTQESRKGLQNLIGLNSCSINGAFAGWISLCLASGRFKLLLQSS